MPGSRAIRQSALLLGAIAILVMGYWTAFEEIFFIWDGWAWKACARKWASDPALLLSLDPSYSFRPLCRGVYCLLHLCFKDYASGYLLVILALHLAAALTTGSLIRRITGDIAAARWTVLLFCAMSSFTEAIQWIGAFPHVLLGFEVLLFLLLIVPDSNRGSVSDSDRTASSKSDRGRPFSKKLIFAAIVLVLAILTREPWVVAAPLMVVVLFWKEGWKGLFGSRGLLLLAGMTACVILYLIVFDDIVRGERVPGGESLMAFGIDCVPRMLRSLTLLFVPRVFYAVLLRNPAGGIAIICAVLLCSSLGGKRALRNAVAGWLFVFAALLPFSFYRTEFMCGRYFYLAGVGATYLIHLSAKGVGIGLARWKIPGRAASLVAISPLVAWMVLSLLGIRVETRQVYQRAWTQSRCARIELEAQFRILPEGGRLCVLGLPDQNAAIWQCMANYLFPGNSAHYILASDSETLLQEIEAETGASEEVRFLFWTGKPNYEGELVPHVAREAKILICGLDPKPVWGWPGNSMPEKVGALVIEKP